MRTSLGNVSVHRGIPHDGNPYRGCLGRQWPITSITGDERVAALQAFEQGDDTSQYTFWHAPSGGGARQILDQKEIDWTGLRTKP